MARTVILHKTTPTTRFTAPKQLEELSAHLTREVNDAIAMRASIEQRWVKMLTSYEGVPKRRSRDTPVENAPNIEVTLSATHADTVNAQALDMLFNISPFITARATENSSYAAEKVKAVQRFADHIALAEMNLKPALEHVLLDDIQLGTGVFYVPWTKSMKKTKTHKVTKQGPVSYAWPVEDVLVPTGACYTSIDDMPWIGLRTWMQESQLALFAQQDGWDISTVHPISAKDLTKVRREQLGRSFPGSAVKGDMYEIIYLFLYYDIDNDGVDEDLFVVWDRTSRNILKCCFNKYDYRPIEYMVYQRRAHMFYGMGVVEMLEPYQSAMTDLVNFWVLNAMLANARLWISRNQSVPDTVKIWPGKVQQYDGDPGDLQALVMADEYSSMPAAISMIGSFAEKRSGVNEMSLSPSQAFGTRTPGSSMAYMMSQMNKRFVPAFNSMAAATAGAVRQGLYRYGEKVKAGDASIMEHISKVVGVEDGQLVIEALRDEGFDEQVTIELTGSSATLNREMDKQNAVLLVNILTTYYSRVIELGMLAANPQAPPEVKQLALNISKAATEVIDRTIRTFDQVRDPTTLLINMNEALDAVPAEQQALGQIMQMLNPQQQGQGQPEKAQPTVQEGPVNANEGGML